MTPVPSRPQQLTLALAETSPHRLDNFLPGSNEQWPALQAALEEPPASTPVYLWGMPGSGKTHLLHACAEQAHARGEQVAAFDPQTPLPWTLSDTTRLILLDDCERFDAHQQHAAFALFIEAASLAVAVVAAGELPPTDLPLRDDLRSRLGWGLVFHLVTPTDAQVRVLLTQAARERGFTLGEEVVSYLMNRCARDLGNLMALLERLDRFSLATQRSVTLALVRQLLNEPAESYAPLLSRPST